MPSADRNNVKAIIFDFDGTIADSAEVFVEALAEILKRPAFTEAEAEELSHMSLREVSLELGIKAWQLPLLSIQGRRKIRAKIDKVRIFKGLPTIIEKLSRDYNLYVLSSNSEQTIEKFLDIYSLGIYFNRIYAGTALTAKAKRLEKLLQKEQLAVRRCIYIGDEVRDVEAAKQIGMKCLAVGWGYNSKKALLALEPDKFCDAPANLIKAVKSLK